MIFDAFALLVTKATFIGLRLFVLYLLAASLGSAEFAPIAFGLTIAEIVRFVADWGVDTLSLRQFTTPDAADASRRFRSVARIKAVASAVAFVCALPLLLIGAGTPLLVAILLSLTAVTSLWLNLAINWLQARGNLRRAAVQMGALGLLTLGAQVSVHVAGVSSVGRFAVLVLLEAVMVLAMMRLAVTQLATMPRRDGVDPIHAWLRAATPIALATILALTYSRFDQVYIRLFYPAAVLGDYTLAARLIEPVLFLVVSLTSTIYARASGLLQRGAERPYMRRAALLWSSGVFGAGVAFSLFLGLVGYVVVARYLPAYQSTPVLLLILLVAMPFRCVNLCLTAFIQSFGHYGKILYISAANFGFILVLVMLLGRTFGAGGAAGAIVIGEILNTILQVLALTRIFRRWREGPYTLANETDTR